MIRRLSLVLAIVVSFVAVIGSPAMPAQAQSVTWQAQFYNNAFLQNPPAFTQNVSIIAFDWGAGSPGSGVGADNWSARFATNTFFQAGTYRFYVLADDAVHLYIDYNNLVIDTFNQNKAAQLQTVDVTLSQGNHQLQLDFQELSGNAYVYLSWADLATNPSGPNFGQPSSGGSSGGACNVQYYNNPNLQGSPAVTTSVAGISNDWGAGAPAAGIGVDNFSARFTCAQALNGTYQLKVKADDGVRVYVNGVLYIDEWHAAAANEYNATFTLSSGTYNVVAEYFEQSGNAFINFNLSNVATGTSSAWAAQYYNNTSLAGSPTTTATENDPSHDFGTGSPAVNVGVDNFSARWTSTQSLSGGTYRFKIDVDDGVRVYVDGAIVIDEWLAAQGRTFTRDVSLAAGPHTIVVEFLELGGSAFLRYNFTRIDGSTGSTGGSTSTGASATINTSRLNVRNAPNRFTGAVLVKVSRGEVYPVVGRNQDGSWYQINVNGTVGWVSAPYVLIANVQNVPVIAGTTTEVPAATGFTITSRVRVNMRGAPTTAAVIVAVFTPNGIGQVLGRSADNQWYKISFNDVIGWVNVNFIIPQQQFDLNKIPVMPI